MGLFRRHVYDTTTAGLIAFFMAAFIVVAQLKLPLLTDPQPGLSTRGWAAGALGIALLIADVVLPVPSSG